MIDFKLTKTGDLVFIDSFREKSQMTISFNVSSAMNKKISFYVKENKRKIPKDSLSIRFDVEKRNIKKDDCIVANEHETKRQMVENVLSTTVGELSYRKEFGSMLETIRYDQLYDRDNIEKTKSIIKEAINNVLPETEVNIEPYYRAYPVFKQGFKVEVYESGNIIYKDFI